MANVIPFDNDRHDWNNKKRRLKVSNVSLKTELPSHLTELFEKSTENLNHSQELQFHKLLIDNADVFAKFSSDLGRTSVVEHTINVGEAKPIKQPARRPPKTLFMKEDEIIQEQLKAWVIRESASPWASPMVYVLKKDGSIRPCVDYRKLNEVTLKDAYPLPRMNDCLDSFGNA